MTSLLSATPRRVTATINVGVVVALHVLAIALFTLGHMWSGAMLGMVVFAYTRGLLHALDADHLAMIDGSTRKLPAPPLRGPTPVSPYLAHARAPSASRGLPSVGGDWNTVGCRSTTRKENHTMSPSMIARIGKLLAKADSTESTAEAEALFAKAQTLATIHSVDLTVVRYQHTAAEAPEVPEERALYMGTARTLILPAKIDLWRAVAYVNDIHWSVAHDKTVVHPVGFPSDLDTAKIMFDVLVTQMVRFGDEWITSRAWEGDTYWTEAGYRTRNGWRSWEPSVERPVDAKMARRSFYDGFASSVDARLREARTDAVAAAKERDTSHDDKALTVTALALVDKQARLDAARDEVWRARGVRGNMRSYRGATAVRSRTAGVRQGGTASLSARPQISA